MFMIDDAGMITTDVWNLSFVIFTFQVILTTTLCVLLLLIQTQRSLWPRLVSGHCYYLGLDRRHRIDCLLHSLHS